MASDPADTSANYTRITVAVLALLLIVRMVGVIATPLQLGPDEAQYWRWGQSFDWGYYSKPPMIAWAIGAMTSVFGDSEWAVRIISPVLHTVAASFLFLLGRAMFSPRVGMFAALGYILMPGVILSSGLISTDGILLPFWCAGLYALWRLREGAGWTAALGLGVCIGLGFLSKYAMLYFIIGIGLTSLIDPPTRKALLSLNGLIALAMAAAIFAPHMMWNAANEFQTVSHTVDNANLGGDLFNFENALTFLADQMAVFGPIGFLALLGGLIFLRGKGSSEDQTGERWLLCFILPVLIIISVQAVISRAHANWAATAYPAASVLVAMWLCRAKPSSLLWYVIAAITFAAGLAIPGLSWSVKLAIAGGLAGGILIGSVWAGRRPSGLLWAALGLHACLSIVFTALAVTPAGLSEQAGMANAFKRLRGWPETTALIQQQAEAIGATAILVDERENWHGLDYYGRETLDAPVFSWRRFGGIKAYADTRPLTDAEDDTVLVASIRRRFRPGMREDFAEFERLGTGSIPLGGGKTRTFVFYRASGFNPLPRGPEWEDRFEGMSED